MSYFIDTMLETKNPEELFRMIDETEELKLGKQFIMKDIGLTSRVFNHWITTGLVTNTSKAGDYRYEFSFIELIWFNIVKELREYGFPLEIIKVVYKTLMEPILFRESINNLPDKEKNRLIADLEAHKETNPEYTEYIKRIKDELFNPKTPNESFNDVFLIPLQLLFAGFLIDRTDIRLLINSNGNVFSVSDKMGDAARTQELMVEYGFDNESYVSISLLKFLKKFILKKENQQFTRDHNFLNENELYILSLIREGKAKAITIKFEAHKPKYIEITEEKKLFAESRISDTLLSRQYQEIIIKTQDGNISYANVTTKKKLK